MRAPVYAETVFSSFFVLRFLNSDSTSHVLRIRYCAYRKCPLFDSLVVPKVGVGKDRRILWAYLNEQHLLLEVP